MNILLYILNRYSFIQMNKKSLLAKNIKKIRLDRGITQEKLAELADMSHMSIVQIETGRRWPRQDSLEAIATALNIEVNELISGQEKGDTNILTIYDASEILAKIADLKPLYRSVVLALIYQDPNLVGETTSNSDKLKSLVQILSKAQ